MMTDLELRLEKIEARLKETEDRLAIYELLASYGPAADSLSEAALSELWDADGVYDADGGPFVGAAAVGALVHQEGHRKTVAAGCAHIINMPRIQVTGDVAVATGYSCLNVHQDDHWKVTRTSANRWELIRTNSGWKVAHRVNRKLNGEEEARAILASAVSPS